MQGSIIYNGYTKEFRFISESIFLAYIKRGETHVFDQGGELAEVLALSQESTQPILSRPLV